MEIKNGTFLSSLIVIFLEESDDQYKQIKPTFDKHGWAFKHDKNIFFDVPTLRKKKLSDKHNLLFIEAHETSHYILDHKKTSIQNEAEADYGGISLCKSHNLTESYKIGLDVFERRNNISFKDFHKTNGERLHKYLKVHM